MEKAVLSYGISYFLEIYMVKYFVLVLSEMQSVLTFLLLQQIPSQSATITERVINDSKGTVNNLLVIKMNTS